MASSQNQAASAETRNARFEQGVALSLNLWPALTLAVQNNWGGPDSADKRAWLAGQVVEQFPSLTDSSSSSETPLPKAAPATTRSDATATTADEEPDAEYIEELLLQVLLDEFEVNVDDESGFDVATEIIRLRAQCARGNFDEVDRLQARWESRKGAKVVMKQGEDQDNDTDWDDSEGDDDDDDDGDQEMDDAPALVSNALPKKEKKEPEIDEDGFTTVTRKR